MQALKTRNEEGITGLYMTRIYAPECLPTCLDIISTSSLKSITQIAHQTPQLFLAFLKIISVYKETPQKRIIKPILTRENFLDSVKNYLAYKNSFHGLRWFNKSKESFNAILDIAQAPNDRMRYKLAKKYADKNPQRAFAKALSK